MPRARVFLRTLLLLHVFSFACGDDVSSGNQPIGLEADPPLEIDGNVSGLWWSARDRTLLLADDDAARILGWNDEEGVHVLQEFEAPALGQPPTLGPVVQLPGGTIVVTRTSDALLAEVTTITPEGMTASVPGLDPTRQRIGLSADPGGALYVSWTVRVEGERRGSVSKIGLAGYDDLVAEGFDKPTAVLALPGELYVADQPADQVMHVDLASGEVTPFVIDVKRPDVLSVGPDGSILVAVVGDDAWREVLLVDSDGSTQPLVGGFEDVRGIAWDPEGARLFVAERARLSVFHLAEPPPE